MTAPNNGELSRLLWQASSEHADHRSQALRRAARNARFWSREARHLLEEGDPLTDLDGVGPWVSGLLQEWIATESRPEPDPLMEGFLTWAEVRVALDEDPGWETAAHADLQVHSTDSDGHEALPVMADAALTRGRAYMAATDHSKSLRIAHGQDEAALAEQGERIIELNRSFAVAGQSFRVLRSIEMDVFEDGSIDMDPDAVAELDIVLGAFHSKLRGGGDATARYVAAHSNPSVHILAHPTTRMYGRRPGLDADWPRVFAHAAEFGKAVELDGTPNRQDLSVGLARIALEAGVRWSRWGRTHTACPNWDSSRSRWPPRRWRASVGSAS